MGRKRRRRRKRRTLYSTSTSTSTVVTLAVVSATTIQKRKTQDDDDDFYDHRLLYLKEAVLMAVEVIIMIRTMSFQVLSFSTTNCHRHLPTTMVVALVAIAITASQLQRQRMQKLPSSMVRTVQ